MQGTPEAAYQAFWTGWSAAAVAVSVALVALALVAARLWLVNPVIRSQRESAGRIVRAIQLSGTRMQPSEGCGDAER